MTTQELIDYYANLLILQYREQPKAYATIQALAKPVIMDQLPLAVQNAYNLIGDDTAVGKQLDVLGKYVGVSRNGYGFQGQPITLNDADFLSFIRMGIARNNTDGTLDSIDNLLADFFPTGSIFVFDNQNMTINYLISFAAGSLDLVEMFITQNLLIKPTGVLLASIIYAPTVNNFFGFRTYQANNTFNRPFSDYHTPVSGIWMDYHYALVI